jgi:glycosyltransferase involved in cell wall biosynthesis
MITESPPHRAATGSETPGGGNRARSRYVFVLEKTLGHVSHAKNLERTLARRSDLDTTLVAVDPASSSKLDGLPPLRNWSLRASWSARSQVRDALRGGRADALFIHTQVAALFLVGTMRHVPTVISLDATPVNFDSIGEPYGHHRGGDTVEWAKLQLHARVFGATRALVTFSHWAARSLVEDYGVRADKVSVIPQGVDLGLFRPADQLKPSDRVRILFVGGDFIRKGGPDLLEAMRGMGNRAELDVVTGTGGWSPPAEIRCRVHTNLSPQSPQLIELFRRADIFVLPTRADCSPNVVAEALGSGLPIIATRMGGIPELVQEGVNGFLVSVGSPRDLSRAIEGLVDQPQLRRAMGFESRRLAEREHDATRNGEALLTLMARISEPR